MPAIAPITEGLLNVIVFAPIMIAPYGTTSRQYIMALLVEGENAGAE